MAEPRSTAEEAGDPSTAPQRLLELTEKHPQLHRLIVLNPSCPDVARQWILATDPWAKQAYDESLAAAAEDAAPAPAPADPGPEDPDPEEPDAEEPDAVSVWGDLGTSPAASPAPAPAGTDAPQEPEPPAPAPVRISEKAAVVPLGATPATAASPTSATDATPTYGAPPAYGTAPMFAAGVPTDGADPDQDDGARTRRRTWYACGGCALLALVLVLVLALVGRSWLAGDEEEYQRDSSTTAAEDSPSEQPTEGTDEEESPDPVSPAPEDAHEMTELRSPTGNISCLLEEDSAACSVLEYDFSDSGLEGCEAGPFSIQVAEGEAAPACGSSFLSEEGTSLEYDESATYGAMACTSRFDGMTCWNTLTGKGFMVNRVTYETF